MYTRILAVSNMINFPENKICIVKMKAILKYIILVLSLFDKKATILNAIVKYIISFVSPFV